MAFKNPLVSTLAIQAPRAFTGTLNSNEVFSGIFNMIIGQMIRSENAATAYTELVDLVRTEGSMYGDMKLFYDADELSSYEFKGDNDLNVLETHRPKDPVCQKVVIDQFRQIALTVDEYLSKRAWADEYSFGNMQSLMLKRIGDCKRDHEAKLVNVFIGTTKSSSEINTVSVSFESGASTKADLEAQNRINAQKIATEMANLMDELKDSSTKYNEYGYYRSFNPSDLVIVYNAKYANEIRLTDLPTIFHKEGLEPATERKLPAKYFGRDIVADTDIGSGKVIKTNGEIDSTKGTVRSKYECEFIFEGVKKHFHSGDELPSGVKISYEGGSVSNPDLDESQVYIEDSSIICKIVHKDSIPFMSAFSVGTEFWNAKALTTNKYTTWGYSELTYLKGLPFLAVVKA